MSPGITIVEYDAAWPGLFRREAERIQSALGESALRMEHTGSTSVPGLAAKPVIDLLLVVADSSNEAAYVPPLERVGYYLRLREPSWHEHRLLKGPDTDINLHVFSEGCAEINRILKFRDWLRTNRSDRDLYERTKRGLAAREWKDVDHYANAKTAVIEMIIEKALKSHPE